jgi:hypothetical protein
MIAVLKPIECAPLVAPLIPSLIALGTAPIAPVILLAATATVIVTPKAAESTKIHEIDLLNDIVASKTKKWSDEATGTGRPITAPEIVAVQHGQVVYKRRFTLIPKILIILSLLVLLSHCDTPKTVILACILLFVWYDFLSGVLHVVLDNPGFIDFPLLGVSVASPHPHRFDSKVYFRSVG